MSRIRLEPFTIALVCTVLLASLLPAHGAFAHWFGIATNLAIALLFFMHGARLSWSTVLAGILHWRLQLVIFVSTFVLFPLIGIVVGHLLTQLLPHDLILGIMYVCLLPSTVQSSIAFTSIARGNVPGAICAASLSNIVGVILTPLLVGVLLSVSGKTGFDFSAVWKILLQLFLPFVIGQLCQPWIGDWMRARKKMLNPVDRGSILMVVYSAFSAAVINGIWHDFSLSDILLVALVNGAILAFVLFTTMRGSRLLGFSREDEITITFCGSKKSLASGVPMASAIFSPAAVGAIVLPIMLFHQMQLLACSVIAQHYARRDEEKPASPAVDDSMQELERG